MQGRNFARWFAQHRLVGYVAAGLVGVAAMSTSLVASRADTGITTSPTATPGDAGNPIPPGIGPALLAGNGGGGGAHNVVLVVNRQDGSFKFDGKVQINQIRGPSVAPLNLAEGYSSCSSCQTLAVAMQIDLVTGDPHFYEPKNLALAINFQSLNAHTAAVALQYAIPVADPSIIPDHIKALAQQMNEELRSIRKDSASQTISVGQAKTEVLGVINQFNDLDAWLNSRIDETTSANSPNAGPLPPVSGSPTESTTPAAGATPTTTPTATPSPSSSP